MQALCALPKQQILFLVMHNSSSFLLLTLNGWRSFAQQQQRFAINNALWLALSIAQQEQPIAVNNTQRSALSITPTEVVRM